MRIIEETKGRISKNEEVVKKERDWINNLANVKGKADQLKKDMVLEQEAWKVSR